MTWFQSPWIFVIAKSNMFTKSKMGAIFTKMRSLVCPSTLIGATHFCYSFCVCKSKACIRMRGRVHKYQTILKGQDHNHHISFQLRLRKLHTSYHWFQVNLTKRKRLITYFLDHILTPEKMNMQLYAIEAILPENPSSFFNWLTCSLRLAFIY